MIKFDLWKIFKWVGSTTSQIQGWVFGTMLGGSGLVGGGVQVVSQTLGR